MRESINPEILLHPHDHKNKKDWERIFKFLDQELDYKNIQSALGLGAGMGNISVHILKMNPSACVVCEDINPEYLKIIRQRNAKIKTLLHDINQPLPFKNESFDLVSCVGTYFGKAVFFLLKKL